MASNHSKEFAQQSEILKEIKVEDLAFYYEEMVRANLLELEVETPQGKITLKRDNPDKEIPVVKSQHALRRKVEAAHHSEAAVPAAPDTPKIASPIMGTFYRASSPQSAPFVKEGDTVNVGMTLCIVEAMKVMNEIKAENRCRIVKILPENGKAISKGEALFQIEMV